MKLFSGLLAASIVAATVSAPDYVAPYKKKGNSIVYVFSDHRDKKTERYDHTVKITDVRQQGSVRIVNAVQGYTDKGQFLPQWYMKFGYDSLHFFAFAVNRAFPNIPTRPDARISMEGDSLVYPYAMKVGDSLPGATGIRTDIEKQYKSVSTVTVFRRYVSSCDTLDLPYGKVAAYRIESAEKWEDVSSVSTKTIETRECTEWFSPLYGIVKVHTDLGNGTYTETTLYSIPK
jgi:hypothetical protein